MAGFVSRNELLDRLLDENAAPFPGHLCHCADCAVADGNPAQPAPPCTARPWRCGSRAAVLEELASEQPASSSTYVNSGVDSGDLRRFEALDRPDIDRAYRSEASGGRVRSAPISTIMAWLHSYWAAGPLAASASG